jgi:hypothetical protein
MPTLLNLDNHSIVNAIGAGETFLTLGRQFKKGSGTDHVTKSGGIFGRDRVGIDGGRQPQACESTRSFELNVHGALLRSGRQRVLWTHQQNEQNNRYAAQKD